MNIELYNGDCLKVMDGLIEKGIKVDSIITDPPYGMNLTPQRDNSKFKDKKIINDDNLNWVKPFFAKCYDLTNEDSGHLFFCSLHSLPDFLSSLKQVGFTIKNILVWDKDWIGIGGNWRPTLEFIILATRGRFVTKSNNKSNILKYRRLSSDKMVHPTQKPVGLMEELISEPDYNPKTILDPFMGSGITGVACKHLNRNFIGIELDEEYFNIAKKRIDEAINKLDTKDDEW